MGNVATTDPITVEVVRGFLINTVRQMRATMATSGWNVAIVETVDFSCGLISGQGELLAMSDDIPNHVFSIGYHAKLATDTYGDEIYPGDLFLCNDPYTGGDHLNDMLLLHPYFYDDKLRLLIAVRAHWADVGGKNVGSVAGQSREIYEEGVRIPLVKVANRGQINQDLLQVIFANIRQKEENRGDFLAMIGTCKTADEQLNHLFARYTTEVVEQSIEAILGSSERVVREAIAGLPDGEYFFEEYMESDGYTANPMRTQCKLTVSGDHMVFDFAGSASQVVGPMNSGPASTYSAVFVMVKSYLEAATPVNGGSMRPITVICPEGTILSAQEPAPVAGFSEIVYISEHVVLGLLAQLMPEKTGAMPEVGANHTYIGGWDSLRGRHWIFYEYPPGGTAAQPNLDGSNAVCQYDLGDIIRNVPVERVDLQYPLRVLNHDLRQDSGGPGYRRGGLGPKRDIEVLAQEGCILSLVGEGAIIPRGGMSGGYPGAMNVFTIIRDGKEFFPGTLPSKCADFPLRQGDILRMLARGGSGWGDPLTRELERVQEDVALGYVSERQAREAYGVVFADERVDPAASQELRERMRAERVYLFIVPVDTDEYDQLGRRRCPMNAETAVLLGVNDEDVLDYIPDRLGPHLKAWVRIDSTLKGAESPLGSKGRAVLKIKEPGHIWVRPLRPPV